MTTRDSSHSYIHMHSGRHADLFEDFARPGLPSGEAIHVAAHLQPPNPEDEDDVVPDQHAAFGIQRATQPRREPAWRDLGLAELVANPREQPAQGDAHATISSAAAAHADAAPSAAAPNAAAHHASSALLATAAGGAGPRSNARGLVARPGLGRGAGWARDGDAALGVGVRNLPR